MQATKSEAMNFTGYSDLAATWNAIYENAYSAKAPITNDENCRLRSLSKALRTAQEAKYDNASE